MANCIQGEYRFLSEVCLNHCCLEGRFEECEKNHQIISRKVSKSNENQDHKNTDDPLINEEDEHDEFNCRPKDEFDDDFQFNHFNEMDYDSDNVIEISDFEDDEDESRSSLNFHTQLEQNLNSIRQLVLQPSLKEYFSTDKSLSELRVDLSHHDTFLTHLSSFLSNERSFGSRELYLADLNTLNGTNWLNDKIIDGMFDIIQRKCQSVGRAVIAISVAWFHYLNVSFNNRILIHIIFIE